MKVSRASKRRSALRKGDVVRLVEHTSKNYRWWLFQEAEPAEGYILDTWTETQLVYPRPAPVVTRKPPRKSLSRGALRRRLYQRHVPKARWAEILARYANRSLWRMPGEPTVKEALGYAAAKAVSRHVSIGLLVQDEYHLCVAPGFAELARTWARTCRKIGVTHLATQSWPDGFPLPHNIAPALLPAQNEITDVAVVA